jgi:hypothetical protein
MKRLVPLLALLALAACESTSDDEIRAAPPRPAPGLSSADFSDANHVATEQEASEWAASSITDDNADQALEELAKEIEGDG